MLSACYSTACLSYKPPIPVAGAPVGTVGEADGLAVAVGLIVAVGLADMVGLGIVVGLLEGD